LYVPGTKLISHNQGDKEPLKYRDESHSAVTKVNNFSTLYPAHTLLSILGVFLTLFGVMLINQHILMSLPLGGRMILMLGSQWVLFFVPGLLMWVNKENLADLGIHGNNLILQVGVGVALALLLSLVGTVIPILLGFKDMVGSTQYTKLWQFVFEFVYRVLGVALAEELIFRGYLFKKILQIKDNKALAIISTSLLFGVFHIFHGNLLQVGVTALLGVVFCLLREKIKKCSLISLVFVHGVYDALIIVWVYLL